MSDPRTPFVDGPSASAVLEGAQDRVARRLHAPTPSERSSEELTALATLTELGRSVAEVLHGGDAAAQVEQVSLTPDLFLLLDELRGEVLSADGGADATTVLDVLRAVERIRDAALEASVGDLRARMSRPGAFRLLVDVAHDLRSPLNSILFLAETIRNGHSGPVTDQQRSQLGLIYGAALGLNTVLNDVVDHASHLRIDPGNAESFSLSEVVAGVLEVLGPIAEEKGVELRGRTPEHDRAHGHPTHLGRIFLNLGSNALKFTQTGSVELGVRRLPGGGLEFYVQDTGRGISPERQEDLFEPFKQRLEQTGEFFSSGGIGLTIVRRLVTALGSELRYETEQGEGTRFYFVLSERPAP